MLKYLINISAIYLSLIAFNASAKPTPVKNPPNQVAEHHNLKNLIAYRGGYRHHRGHHRYPGIYRSGGALRTGFPIRSRGYQRVRRHNLLNSHYYTNPQSSYFYYVDGYFSNGLFYKFPPRFHKRHHRHHHHRHHGPRHRGGHPSCAYLIQ